MKSHVTFFSMDENYIQFEQEARANINHNHIVPLSYEFKLRYKLCHFIVPSLFLSEAHALQPFLSI